MKKNKFRIMALAVAALPMTFMPLTSCSDQDTIPAMEENAVVFTADVSQAPASRADVAYTPTDGTMTVYYGSLTSTQRAHYAYNTSTSAWTCTSAKPLYWQDLTAVDGKYTFFAMAPSADLTTVSRDQSTKAEFIASDLLIGRTEVESKQKVGFTLKHVLSQILVNVKTVSGDEALTTDELNSVTMTIGGVKHDFTIAAGTTADVPAVVTAAGQPESHLIPFKEATAYRLIIPAQELAANALELNFKVTVGSNTRTYTYVAPDAHSLLAGTIKQFDITISKTKLALSDVKVTDWATGNTASATLAVAVTGTAETVTGDEPAFSSMTLWVANEALKNFSSSSGTKLGSPRGYKKGTDGTWSSSEPIYLDELSDKSVIYATAINTDASGNEIEDEVTGYKDNLIAGAVGVKGGKAAIQFHHGLAQMTVKLVKGANFTADIANAVITTPPMAKSASMNTNAEGYLYLATSGTETVKYDVVSEATHLVVPQTLEAGWVFTVKLSNNRIYEAKLANDVNLEAGKNTTITLTLTLAKVGVSAAVTAWGTASASAIVQLAGTNSENNITGITEVGDLTLTYVKDNALTTNVGTFSYDGSTWTNAAPLYWDNIDPTAHPYTFAALFTPAGTGKQKDYLVGKGTATVHGVQVALGTMTHALAKMTITLKDEAGNAYTGLATTNGSVVNLTDYNAVAVKADGTADITMANATSAIAFTSGTPLYVAPQELTNDNTLVLTRANGNTYQLALNTLTGAFGTTPIIEAGKHYELTVTVNETGVGISATIADWENKTGSGTVTPDF